MISQSVQGMSCFYQQIAEKSMGHWGLRMVYNPKAHYITTSTIPLHRMVSNPKAASSL